MFEAITYFLNDSTSYSDWINSDNDSTSIDAVDTIFEWDMDKTEIIYPKWVLLLTSDDYMHEMISFSGDYAIEEKYTIRFHQLIDRQDKTSVALSEFMNDVVTVMEDLQTYKFIREWNIDKTTPFRNEIEAQTHLLVVDINITLFTRV